jgi:hypothetical protein
MDEYPVDIKGKLKTPLTRSRNLRAAPASPIPFAESSSDAPAGHCHRHRHWLSAPNAASVCWAATLPTSARIRLMSAGTTRFGHYRTWMTPILSPLPSECKPRSLTSLSQHVCSTSMVNLAIGPATGGRRTVTGPRGRRRRGCHSARNVLNYCEPLIVIQVGSLLRTMELSKRNQRWAFPVECVKDGRWERNCQIGASAGRVVADRRTRVAHTWSTDGAPDPPGGRTVLGGSGGRWSTASDRWIRRMRRDRRMRRVATERWSGDRHTFIHAEQARLPLMKSNGVRCFSSFIADSRFTVQQRSTNGTIANR